MRYASIRFDDVCPTMKRDSFNMLYNSLKDVGVMPLLGVVPDNQDPKLKIDSECSDFWANVKKMQEEGCSIAMHGTYHVYCTNKSGILKFSKKSEYSGLSYEEQYNKLKEGKDILLSKGIKTDIFMSPSHSYDKNTIRAAYDLGFKIFTDGYSKYPYIYEKVLFIPCRSWGVTDKSGVDTICVHPNTLTENDLNNLSNSVFLRGLVSFNELVKISLLNIKPYHPFMDSIKTWLFVLKNKILAFSKRISK